MISHLTFKMICWVWIAVAVIIFPVLLKVTQPYGRHSKNNWALYKEKALRPPAASVGVLFCTVELVE